MQPTQRPVPLATVVVRPGPEYDGWRADSECRPGRPVRRMMRMLTAVRAGRLSFGRGGARVQSQSAAGRGPVAVGSRLPRGRLGRPAAAVSTPSPSVPLSVPAHGPGQKFQVKAGARSQRQSPKPYRLPGRSACDDLARSAAHVRGLRACVPRPGRAGRGRRGSMPRADPTRTRSAGLLACGGHACLLACLRTTWPCVPACVHAYAVAMRACLLACIRRGHAGLHACVYENAYGGLAGLLACKCVRWPCGPARLRRGRPGPESARPVRPPPAGARGTS